MHRDCATTLVMLDEFKVVRRLESHARFLHSEFNAEPAGEAKIGALPMHLQISKEGCTDRPHHAATVFDRPAAGTKDNGCISFSYDCLMRHNDLVDNKPAPEIAQDAVFGGLLL